MNRKEFKINATLDTAEFDKSIESMQKRLRELYAPSDVLRMQQQTGQKAASAGFPGMSAPTSEDFKRATAQQKRDQDASIRSQVEGQERLMKLMALREKSLKELKNQQESMVKGSKEELATLEKIQRVEENLNRQRETYRQKDKALNNSLDLNKITNAYEKGGILGAAKSGAGVAAQRLGIPGIVGLGGMAVGAAGGALSTFSNYYRDYGRMPIDTNMALANAAQGSIGRDVSNIYGKRTAFEMPFMGERSRAAQQALKAMSTGQSSDTMSIMGRMGLWGGAGMASGAGIGAGIGGGLGALGMGVGAIPGAGIGAGIGGAAGGLMGGVGGLMSAMGDPMMQAKVLSGMPIIGKEYGNKYQSLVAERAVGDYNSAYEAEKNLNPYKKAAVGEYEQNYMRNLEAQRSMGMDNDSFYGDKGFLNSSKNAGFTPEIALQMSQGILGAGGSTQMAGNSVIGSQAARGLGLTNASSILGSLSGSMGGAAQSSQSMIKILAEGMSLGLDQSKFAEENRRFTQTAAEIISRTGTGSSEDAQRIAGKFGSFVADNTNAGITAAKSAYEEYQQMSSETSGPRGVMRAAGFMSDKNLSKMSTMDKQALMQIPEDQVNEDNTYVQSLAAKYNIEPKDIVSSIQGVNKGSQNRYKEADQIRDRVQGRMKEMGISRLDKETFKTLPKDMQADIGSMQSFQMNEYGFKDTQTSQSRAFGAINGDPQTMSDIQGDKESILKCRMSGRTGKIEDDSISSAAGDSGTVLKNFNELRPSLQQAAVSAAAFTDKIREMNAELLVALESARKGETGSADAVRKMLEKTASMGGIQNQSSGTRK